MRAQEKYGGPKADDRKVGDTAAAAATADAADKEDVEVLTLTLTLVFTLVLTMALSWADIGFVRLAFHGH